MLAAWYEKNGTAAEVFKVGERAEPEPQTGEVLVKLSFSGINPSDVKSRAARPLAGDVVIPHSDGAGVVVKIGPGVAPGRLGERVWVWNGQWKRPFGTAAQCIALPSAQAVSLPANVDFEAGACVGIPLLTAWHALSLLGDVNGKTLLVTGAASSVGDYATQLASRCGGATVIGTVGSELKAQYAGRSGASQTIDYKTEDVAERILSITDGRGVDGVIDMDFSSTAPLATTGCIANHATIVSYGSNVAGEVTLPYREFMFRCLTLRQFAIYELTEEQRAAALEGVCGVLTTGVLDHTIAEIFELADIIQAHESVECGKSGKPGKVVLRIPDSH
jgi:NADPH:quinone reductase